MTALAAWLTTPDALHRPAGLPVLQFPPSPQAGPELLLALGMVWVAEWTGRARIKRERLV